MKSAIIILNSITEANKAKKQLMNFRIKSTVEKINIRVGDCGYGIRIYDKPEKICRFLETVHIRCTEIIY
jgi:hypothetical protein